MGSTAKQIDELVSGGYEHGFVTEIDTDVIPPGLSEDVIRLISRRKEEPEWVLEYRLKAYRHWLTMEPPSWSSVHHPPIDHQAISYFAAPKSKPQLDSLDEVDPELLRTYEKLGIPIEEQKALAGVAVDAVFDRISPRQGSFSARSPRRRGNTRICCASTWDRWCLTPTTTTRRSMPQCSQTVPSCTSPGA